MKTKVPSNQPSEMPRLIIVGTVHVDIRSVEETRRVVEEVHPQVVAIELCTMRYGYLMKHRGKEKSGWRVGSIGWWASQLEKRVGEILDVFPGSEMVSAIEAAEKLDCRIALIDQPITITLQRIAEAPLREKLKMYLALIGAGIYLTIPGRKIIELTDDTPSALAEFEKQFPYIFKILVTERNEYMATVLNSILTSTEGRVVAVVGKGHQRELGQILGKWTS